MRISRRQFGTLCIAALAGAAAALGVVAIIIVALGTYLANRLSGRGRVPFTL